MTPEEWRRARRTAFAAYIPVVLTLTLWPKLKVPGPERSDLVAHFGCFGLWAALLMGAGVFGPPLSLRNMIWTFVVSAAFAGLDEGLQAIPIVQRTCAWDDWAANVGGIALACIGAAALRARRAATAEPEFVEPTA